MPGWGTCPICGDSMISGTGRRDCGNTKKHNAIARKKFEEEQERLKKKPKK